MKGMPVSGTHIDAWVGEKDIAPGPLEVYRNGLIVWTITNREKGESLTVRIDNFVPKEWGKPLFPVRISTPVTLTPGATGIITGLVHGVGQGHKTKIPYTYKVFINRTMIDPEIVVCDDPGTPFPPRAKKKPTKKSPRKAKKKTAKK